MIAPDRTGDEKSIEQWELDTVVKLGDVGIFLPEDGTPNELVGKIMAALNLAATLGCVSYGILDTKKTLNIKKTLYLDMVLLLEEIVQEDDRS
jgi:hypothetical protein